MSTVEPRRLCQTPQARRTHVRRAEASQILEAVLRLHAGEAAGEDRVIVQSSFSSETEYPTMCSMLHFRVAS